MEKELPQPDTIKPKITISDFQIYQLFSHATKNNPELFLPNELIFAIATTAHEITQENQRRYEESCCHHFGKYIRCGESLLFFLRTRANINTDQELTTDILKACLQHSGKLLSTFKNRFNETILHIIMPTQRDISILFAHRIYYCIDVLCQATGNDLMNLLCAQNNRGETALHIAVEYSNKGCIGKLITYAGDKAYELVSIKNGTNHTALMCAYRIGYSNTNPKSDPQMIIDFLESFEKTT